MKEIFINIYNKNEWSSKESVSGTGSEMGTTKEIREQLPNLFKKYGIKRLLDFGCGDFNWMKEIVGSLDYYHGVDVVEEVIANNKKKYAKENIKFSCNVKNDFVNSCESFDAVLLRDVLVHLSYMNIAITLGTLSSRDIKYILTTSFLAETENRDISTGSWRRLNLMKEPFDFPPPLETIVSYSEPYNVGGGVLYDKTLSLWKLKNIRE